MKEVCCQSLFTSEGSILLETSLDLLVIQNSRNYTLNINRKGLDIISPFSGTLGVSALSRDCQISSYLNYPDRKLSSLFASSLNRSSKLAG